MTKDELNKVLAHSKEILQIIVRDQNDSMAQQTLGKGRSTRGIPDPFGVAQDYCLRIGSAKTLSDDALARIENIVQNSLGRPVQPEEIHHYPLKGIIKQPILKREVSLPLSFMRAGEIIDALGEEVFKFPAVESVNIVVLKMDSKNAPTQCAVDCTAAPGNVVPFEAREMVRKAFEKTLGRAPEKNELIYSFYDRDNNLISQWGHTRSGLRVG